MLTAATDDQTRTRRMRGEATEQQNVRARAASSLSAGADAWLHHQAAVLNQSDRMYLLVGSYSLPDCSKGPSLELNLISLF